MAPGGGGGPGSGDKPPGQHVFQGDDALEKAADKKQKLEANGMDVEITVVLSAYKDEGH